MILIGDNNVVEQLSANGADQSLGNTVLPGRSIGGARRHAAHVPERCFDASMELSVASDLQGPKIATDLLMTNDKYRPRQ